MHLCLPWSTSRHVREGVDERCLEQRDQVVAEELFLLDSRNFGGGGLDEGRDPVDQLREPRDELTARATPYGTRPS